MRGADVLSNSAMLLAGHNITEGALRSVKLGRTPLVILDAGVTTVPAEFAPDATILRVGTTFDPTLLDLAIVVAGASSVVGIGGGRVMDLAKLARLILFRPALLPVVRTRAARGGYVTLPAEPTWQGEPIPLALVPTTIGTGSESSSVACMLTADGRRLVGGAVLRADYAVLDSAHTRALPATLVREGLMEILLRLAGSAIGSEPSSISDHATKSLIGAVVSLGEITTRRMLTPVELLFAAQLCTETHRGWALVGRATYAAKHWFLANELTFVTGERKIPTTLLLLPSLWSRISLGDERWGRAARLDEVWSWIKAAAPGLPADPALGIAELGLRWQVASAVPPTASQCREAAERVIRWWGTPLPMLPRLDRAALEALLLSCTAAQRSSPALKHQGR